MKAEHRRVYRLQKNLRWIHWGGAATLIASAALVINLYAQSPSDHGSDSTAAGSTAAPASPTLVTRPNYALEARFLPDSVNKLVFDLSVTPHWFTQSDKFWYSYRTTEGTSYYIVDPVKRTKSPLWDNAKI